MLRASRWPIAAALVFACLTATACDDAEPAEPGTQVTETSAEGDTVTGEAVGRLGDPCALLSAEDITTSLGLDVLAVTRLAEETDEDGTSQMCVFTTDGASLDAGGLGLLSAMAGGTDTSTLPAAGLGVVRIEALPDPDAEIDEEELPPGSRQVAVGRLALAVPGPTGGGAGIVQMTDNGGFYLMVIQQATVSADQLEQLIRAAAGRF